MYLNQVKKKNLFAKAMAIIITIVLLVGNSNLIVVKAETMDNKNINCTEVYKNSLTDDEIEIYDLIKKALDDKVSYIKINNEYSMDALKNIYACVLMDNPDIYYTSGKVSFNLTSYFGFKIDKLIFKYSYNKNLKEDYNKNLNISMNLFNSYIDVNSMSDTEKFERTYSYFIKNIEYDKSAGSESYSAIVNNIANELGYSKGFVYALRNVGIDSFVVSGTRNGEEAAWVMARIDNEYYNFDPVYEKTNEEKIIYKTNAEMHNLGYKYMSSINYSESGEGVKTYIYDKYSKEVLNDMDKKVNDFYKKGNTKVCFRFDTLQDYVFAKTCFEEKNNLNKIKINENNFSIYTNEIQKEILVSIR